MLSGEIRNNVNYPKSQLVEMYPPGSIETIPLKQTFKLSQGRAGVFETAEMMAACVRGEIGPDYAGFESPAIKQLAATIEGEFFGLSFPESVFSYTQSRIRYEEHPLDTQIVQDALATIREGKADCVSMSVLIATLLASRDFPVWFVLQDTGSEYTHVYCEALINGKLTALDAVSKDPMGWRQTLPETGFETTWPIFF